MRSAEGADNAPRLSGWKHIAGVWLQVEEKKGAAAKIALLRKMGLVDYAIEYAAEAGDFAAAHTLAQQAGAAAKVPEIHLKHAMHLEVSAATSAVGCVTCCIKPGSEMCTV